MADQVILNNRYRILGLVGEGGMAKVYKAEDRLLERAVAVKVLREQYASDQAFVERFRQEARSAAGLAHPNIVSVYDVGIDGNWNYIVMEYVEGPSLKDLILQGAPFTNVRAVDIGLQILSALSFAHEKGIVHRDIKPQNILISSNGTAKVTDFGIARAATGAQLTETGVVLGTVHYFSPEQARGDTATPASDIYAIGVVLYEMLTGRLPFQGDSTLAIALKHVQEQPQPPSKINPRIPPSIENIIVKAMAKEPAARYPSAEVMKQALTNYRQMGEQMTAPVSMIPATSPVQGKSVSVTPIGISRIDQKKRGIDWFLITLAVLILGFVIASIPVAAKVYELYFNPVLGAAAPAGTPTPAPTPVAPTATATTVPRVVVPEVVAMLYADARKKLEGENLQIRIVEERPDDKHEPMTVLSQSAKPGTEVPAGYVVDVVVSKGPERVAVPGVIGEVLNAAVSQLKAARLEVEVKEEYSDSAAAGVIMDQKPQAGARVPIGSKVEITMSKGRSSGSETRNRIVVPPLVGLPEAEARKRIDSVGLINTYANYQGPGDIPDSELQKVPPGYVLSQQPPPGTVIEPGQDRNVYLAVRKQ